MTKMSTKQQHFFGHEMHVDKNLAKLCVLHKSCASGCLSFFVHSLSTGRLLITLASNSQTRKQMLENAGVKVTTYPARVDEESIRASLIAENSKARDIADCLADAKAQKVSSKVSGWVLGADQVLDFNGQIISKPESPQELTSQLEMFSGHDHDLYSAAVVYKDGAAIWRHIGVARMSVRTLSKDFIGEYVEEHFETVRSSVGGYHLEGVGAQLFSRVQGDYFTVLGLPLLNVLDFLRIQGELKQ